MNEEFQKYFRDKILQVMKINHKGNNQLFKITTHQKNYLLKKYSTIQKDEWNRGKTEFKALNHFWNSSFRDIPKPVDFYEKDNVGIYSFEEGRVLSQEEIKEQDIIEAANFLAKLHNLGLEDKKQFPLERTGCLSIYDYLSLVKKRIKSIKEDLLCGKRAEDFLNNQVIPKVENLKIQLLNEDEINLEKKLSLEEQVITPGDFGFHNILKNDRYIFLDFEYCGRDDPAKQILDFLHHDKTKNIDRTLKNLFLEHYKEKTSPPTQFEQRLKLVDSLIGMNWVLIYLNPLSKNYQKHMEFSYQKHINSEEIIEERLAKAEKKLNEISFFLA